MAINFIPSSLPRGNGVDPAAPLKPAPLSDNSQHDSPVAEVDQVRLTPESMRLRQHMDAPEKPPMNEAKIKALREAITAGTYQVNSERLAGKLLDFESALA